MEGDSVLGNLVAASLVLLFGAVLAFAGYRLFLILLPIYGFFVGLALGAHSVQALFGDGFLSTATSWVVGFFVGLLFAALSYLFWFMAVAIVAGSLGYSLVAALFSLFGADLDVLVWVVGVLVGIVFAIAALMLNLQKIVVIVATAFAGAAAIVMTFLMLFTSETTASIAERGWKIVLDDHPLWLLLFVAVAIGGIVVQLRANRAYEVPTYNRWEEEGLAT
jgi:hypothetical protein